MSTSPAEQPGSGIVTFTQQGDRALDRLAADLVDHCDGSTASIADILEQVLSADIAELADKLGESPVAGEARRAPQRPARRTGPRRDRSCRAGPRRARPTQVRPAPAGRSRPRAARCAAPLVPRLVVTVDGRATAHPAPLCVPAPHVLARDPEALERRARPTARRRRSRSPAATRRASRDAGTRSRWARPGRATGRAVPRRRRA